MRLAQKNRNQCQDTERKVEMPMSESEKKALDNEELEELKEVNGGTIIDGVVDAMDVMGELSVGPDMSVGNSSDIGWFIKNMETGEMIGPFSRQVAFKKVRTMRACGNRYIEVVRKTV